MNRKFGTWLFILLAGLVFFSPIILYVYKFDVGLWEEHSRWAELGAYFSGIYSPIIALLAFLILIGQVMSQNRLNKHHYDTNYLSSNMKNVEYFLEKLEEYLSQKSDEGPTFGEILTTAYLKKSKDELDAEREEINKKVMLNCRKSSDIWWAIYPMLEGLKSSNEVAYQQHYNSARVKIRAVLSSPMCVTLDKIYYCGTTKVEATKLHFWDGK